MYRNTKHVIRIRLKSDADAERLSFFVFRVTISFQYANAMQFFCDIKSAERMVSFIIDHRYRYNRSESKRRIYRHG